MKLAILSMVLAVAQILAEDTAPMRFAMGDGVVNGLAVGEYESSWQQCMVQEGAWVNGGVVAERATIIGPLLRHQRSLLRRPLLRL